MSREIDKNINKYISIKINRSSKWAKNEQMN